MADEDKTGSVMGWLGMQNAPNWRVARPLGYLLGALLAVAVPLLFLFALIAAFAVMWHTIMLGATNATDGINLGAGALIAALLGAPFLIWSTVLKYQTVRYQKEGHITDRINKAVEQLGAEKTVERIGRPVTVWTGKAERMDYEVDAAVKLADRPRTKLAPKEWHESYNENTSEVEAGYWQTVSAWPEERTVIQWQDHQIDLDKNEIVGVEGSWQVFKETAPNIEVRIGAVLSLERIAQDSTRYDNGRDHVRVMEILCAYIRENTTIPSLESESDEEGSFTPRTDIQIAVDVVKRRSQEQMDIEAKQKYRLDLRRCDFRGVDLARGSFRGAIFAQCRFESASLRASDFSGARFDGSVLNFVDCIGSKFIGADMRQCRIDKPEPTAGGFVPSINMGEITGLSLISANVPSLDHFKKNSMTFGTKDTKLNWHLDEERNEGIKIRQLLLRKGEGRGHNETTELQAQLSENAFVNWSPYNGRDMATAHLLAELRKSLLLTGWPYEG